MMRFLLVLLVFLLAACGEVDTRTDEEVVEDAVDARTEVDRLEAETRVLYDEQARLWNEVALVEQTQLQATLRAADDLEFYGQKADADRMRAEARQKFNDSLNVQRALSANQRYIESADAYNEAIERAGLEDEFAEALADARRGE